MRNRRFNHRFNQLWCGLLLVGELLAQASLTGSIQGTVTDATGAALADVKVTAKHNASGSTRSGKTGEAGQYLLNGLPLGEYTLTVESGGFTTGSYGGVQVSVGQTTTQRMVLSLAMVKQQIDVSAAPDSLQSAASSAGVTLGGERVEESPAQNRNYLNFVLTAPAVAASAGANTSRSTAGTRNVANDSGFVFAGMRGRNNSISIDGMDNRDETTGGNRVALGIEMVQEFRVSGNTMGAEFGGAAGGTVNVVTRSGVNLWHGDFTFFTQNEVANARNAEVTEGPKNRFRRYQPGVSIDGPLRRDRTFIAALFEQSIESGEEFSDVPRSLIPVVGAAMALPAFRRAGQRTIARGLFATGESDTESFLKLDHILNPNHTITARYAFSRGKVDHDVQAVDNFSDRSARGSSLLRDDAFVAGWTAVLGPTLLNDVRVQVARRKAGFTPNGEGPMYEIPGVLTFGEAYRLDGSRTETHGEVLESLQVARPHHLIGAGVSIHAVQLDSRLANRFHGIYIFPTAADFAQGRPDVYIQAFGNPQTSMRTVPLGWWVQDRWQPSRGLTIEVGARYDRQWMPGAVRAANRNLAPRLGVAWHPGGNSPWVFRAGAGLFYDRYPLAYLNEAIQKDGSNAFEQYLAGPQALAAFQLALGGALTEPLPGASKSSYLASANFPATYSRKLTGGVERRIDKDTSLTFEFTDLHALHLPRIRNAAGALPPQYQLEQTATSKYRGASVSLHRRLRKEISYLVAYNGGITHDDGSDYDEQPMDPGNIRADWGLSRQDQRHRFAFSGIFDLPVEDLGSVPRWLREPFEDVMLAPIFTAGSGRPVNILATTDVFRTGAYPITARPAGIGRNTASSPGNASLDLRVMKTIRFQHDRSRLQFGLESFNLLNHTNVLRVSQYATAAFGRPLEVNTPRQVQLMMQFEY
jgi:Carboxypeptidase regulatory-like domain